MNVLARAGYIVATIISRNKLWLKPVSEARQNLKSQTGFRVLSFAVQHTESLDVISEIKKWECSRLGTSYASQDEWSNQEQRTGNASWEVARGPSAVTCREETMQDSNGNLDPSRGSGPSVLNAGLVEDNVDIDAEQTVNYHGMGTVEDMESKGKTDDVCEVLSENRESITMAGRRDDETQDVITANQTLTVSPLDNLLKDCDRLEVDLQYPVPLSPMSGEVARRIEYERAMVAEAAVKSGPAMTRDEVLFEDEWLMVVNKPCGVYCEHVLATIPALVTPILSSLSRLILREPVHEKDTSLLHFHLANRLDRDTSGVMVITKSKNAAGKLSNIFTKRQVQKSYIALCRGPRPLWKSLTADSGHGRSRFGAWRVYSKSDVGRALPGGSFVRDMTTHLLVLAINKQSIACRAIPDCTDVNKLYDTENIVIAGDVTSSSIIRDGCCGNLNQGSGNFLNDNQLCPESDEVVIRALPVTGRTHQIRLHCQFVGLPLRGDVKYGGPHSLDGVRYDRHALHAESLSFTHPFTSEKMTFVAPLPGWASDAGVQRLVL
jgi:23S rRNA-/tRNA-specific pseudouridylate synthase